MITHLFIKNLKTFFYKNLPIKYPLKYKIKLNPISNS